MASIKEKDLPVLVSINDSDYLRAVDSSGASKNAPASIIYSGNIALDTTAAPGTIDGDLYTLIIKLGWQSDVID